jgi:uncharacterized membrane-anchored protein YitT (DUF2179 family)
MSWWIIGIISFLVAAWQARSGGEAFNCGFASIFLLWLMMSLWKTLPNENILANRVGRMLMLPDWNYNWIWVVLITAVIGGVAAGFAALSGYLMRKAFVKNPQTVK